MKQIVHIIPAHPVFYQMTEFWINKFPDFDVKVYLFKSQKDDNKYSFKNNQIQILEYSNNSELAELLLNILKDSRLVYFHCMFLPLSVKFRLLLKGIKKYISKIVWIEWGFDLYYWDNSSMKSLTASLLKNFTINFFEKKIPYFVAIHPADVKSYKKIIRGQANIYVAPYRNERGMSKIITDHQKKSMKKKKSEKEPIVIQIGHRADHILNHKETLDFLKRFSDENLLIYLPLCYGDKEYGNKVADYAKTLFGDKVLVQTNVEAYEDYMKRLKSVDIFILNSTRQIALGNLFSMIAMQKKVILPANSVLYDFYKDDIPLFSYDKIKTCSYEELTEDVDMNSARKFIIDSKNINPEDIWKDIFNSIPIK